MPRARVPGQPFQALVDHADGRRGRLCVRAPPAGPSIIGIETVNSTISPAKHSTALAEDKE
jgi:hypothetical protein